MRVAFPIVKATLASLLVAIAVLTLTACTATAASGGAPQGRTELVVFAASSLTEPFVELGRRFEEENPTARVTFSFAGSQQLRAQVEQGARADILAAANLSEMEKATAAGLVDEPHTFARNRLVVVLARDNSARVTKLQDLARPGLKLALAQRSVPAGAYTLAVLDRMSADPSFGRDFKAGVLANVRSEEENVKKVATKVLLGEADGGIVYASDVSAKMKRDVETIEIPAPFNVVAEYPVAVVRDSRQKVMAGAFIAFVLSPTGQQLLAERGFEVEGLPAR